MKRVETGSHIDGTRGSFSSKILLRRSSCDALSTDDPVMASARYSDALLLCLSLSP